MAFKLSRSKRVVEQIELDNGKMIDIDINVGKISIDFNKSYNRVLRLQGIKPTEETVAGHFEELGVAVLEFLNLVLGEKNVITLLEYYNDNYIELLEMIVPFIEECVKPAMIAYAKEKQTIAGEKYKQRKTK